MVFMRDEHVSTHFEKEGKGANLMFNSNFDLLKYEYFWLGLLTRHNYT